MILRMLQGVAFSLLMSAVPALSEPARLSYRILQTKPHDDSSFTQGLIQQGQTLVETSGLYGRSFIQRYDIESGEQLVRQPFSPDLFAEGLAELGEHFYVLSWQAGVLLVLDQTTLLPVRSLRYEGEGWGLTHNGTDFLMTNGSDQIAFRDSKTFELKKAVAVSDGERRWNFLNELEYAQGLVWANVWQRPEVLAIDPDSGEVQGVVDFTDLVTANSRQAGHTVLNGIAYNPERGSFWITGKHWPNLYEVKIDLPCPAAPTTDAETGSK